MGIGQLQPEEGSWGRDSLLCPFSAPGSLGSSRGELSFNSYDSCLLWLRQVRWDRKNMKGKKRPAAVTAEVDNRMQDASWWCREGDQPTNRWNKQTLVAVSHPAGWQGGWGWWGGGRQGPRLTLGKASKSKWVGEPDEVLLVAGNKLSNQFQEQPSFELKVFYLMSGLSICTNQLGRGLTPANSSRSVEELKSLLILPGCLFKRINNRAEDNFRMFHKSPQPRS